MAVASWLAIASGWMHRWKTRHESLCQVVTAVYCVLPWQTACVMKCCEQIIVIARRADTKQGWTEVKICKDSALIYFGLHVAVYVFMFVQMSGCVCVNCVCVREWVCVWSFVLNVSPISHSAMPCSLFWSMYPARTVPPLSHFVLLTHLLKYAARLATLHKGNHSSSVSLLQYFQ